MTIKASATVTISTYRDTQSVTRYYKLQQSDSAAPTISQSVDPTEISDLGWTDTEPTYTSGSTNTLYFFDASIFSNGEWLYSAVSKSSSYEAAKEAYNKAGAAQDAADEAIDTINTKITEEHTNIIESCNNIILEALTTYTATEDFETFRQSVVSQLELLSESFTIRFNETTETLSGMNNAIASLQTFNSTFFTFDVNGFVIGHTENPNRVVISNDRITITVNNVVVQSFDANGNSLIPNLKITRSFEFFGYVIEEADGIVSCAYVGE